MWENVPLHGLMIFARIDNYEARGQNQIILAGIDINKLISIIIFVILKNFKIFQRNSSYFHERGLEKFDLESPEN